MATSFEIRTPQFPYDMSAWCAEKSSTVGEDISKALDILDKGTLDQNAIEMLRFYLCNSLFDISKLMSFSVGADWSTEDPREIQSGGYAGYQKIAKKYGIIDQTDEDRYVARLDLFTDELSKLLGPTRSPNRTFIHELLQRTKLSHPIVTKARDLIELVTMGQMEWVEFTRAMDSEIRSAFKKQSEQAGAVNPHAFGTFVTDPAAAGSAPKAGGDT